MTDIKKYSAIMLDITNRCNIRCSFCVNDWSRRRKPIDMSSENFDKVVELLPLVYRGFLSCGYEATLHPRYIEFFKRISKNTGAYNFITTNLAKKFMQKELEEISELNVDSITISMSSLNAKFYEEIQLGAKFDVFIDNLERLVAIFKEKLNAPELRFVTMVFKQNLDELQYIAEICNKKYLSVLNQFRTIFKHSLTFKKKEWQDKFLPSEKEWNIAVSKLTKLPYNIEFFNPLYTVNLMKKVNRPTNTYFVFRSSGEIAFHEKIKERLPIEFRKSFNIKDIDKPYEFFKVGLQKINEISATYQEKK